MLILNIHYDSITACSTFIGGKLLVGFKHMTDFHPQNTCSVMQLVILEALLYKWEAGFNLVTTTVRPVLRELSSELQTKPLVWSVPCSPALYTYRCRKRICQEQCQFINFISERMPSNCSYCEKLKSEGLFFCCFYFHFTWWLTVYSLPWSTSEAWHFPELHFLFAYLNLTFPVITESHTSLSLAEDKLKPGEKE